MRIAIEDLEALRELNDELEETHLETERALQEEIGASNHANLFSKCNSSLSIDRTKGNRNSRTHP